MAENPEDLIVTDAELRRQLPALAKELKIGGVDGSVPIFPTLAEATAWEAANPGKRALTLEPSTPDTTAPTWNATLTVGTPTDKQVVVTASALASDDRVVAGYEVTYNGTTWSAITPSGKNFTLSGTAGTAYSSTKLRAKDAAGNVSPALAVPSYTMAATPPPVAKTPAEIGSLWGHWDASVAGSLTLSGENVTAWAGITANARTASQATAAQQPVTSTINGKTAVKFNRASSQFLRHQSTFTIDATVGYTAVAVVRWDDSDYSAAQSVFSFAGAGGIKRRPPDGVVVSNTPNANGPSGVKPTAGQVHIVAVRAQNGVATVWSTGVGHTTTAGTPNPSAALDFGRFAGGGSDYGNVTIAEMWTHERALTDDELASLRQYAQQKWGAL